MGHLPQFFTDFFAAYTKCVLNAALSRHLGCPSVCQSVCLDSFPGPFVFSLACRTVLRLPLPEYSFYY